MMGSDLVSTTIRASVVEAVRLCVLGRLDTFAGMNSCGVCRPLEKKTVKKLRFREKSLVFYFFGEGGGDTLFD